MFWKTWIPRPVSGTDPSLWTTEVLGLAGAGLVIAIFLMGMAVFHRFGAEADEQEERPTVVWRYFWTGFSIGLVSATVAVWLSLAVVIPWAHSPALALVADNDFSIYGWDVMLLTAKDFVIVLAGVGVIQAVVNRTSRHRLRQDKSGSPFRRRPAAGLFALAVILMVMGVLMPS